MWKLGHQQDREATKENESLNGRNKEETSNHLMSVDYLTTLKKHIKAVNCIQFHPKGNLCC